ncbi:MAG: hypothetical protein H6734_08415 [Alphaproteobacteria bacterium]|nr:hypothetical protein [Alphaproteobacteria bacterium]
MSLIAAALAAGLAGVVGLLHWPRPPDLDAPRWFRLMLALLLRGEVEASGGTPEDWQAAVERWVPWKGARPDDLSHHPLLVDPVDLPRAYDLRRWLGTAGWEELAGWGAGTSAAVPEAVGRRLPVIWMLVGEAPGPDLLGALASVVGEVLRVPYDGPDVRAMQAALDGLPDDADPRFVLVGAGPGIQAVLRGLHANEGFRDRVLAVVSVAGVLRGAHQGLSEADVDGWMAEHFTQRELDVEIDTRVPYAALQWIDADGNGAFGLPVRDATFPEPRGEPMVRESIDAIDLGPLPVDSDPVRVARALVTFVACWVTSRQGG